VAVAPLVSVVVASHARPLRLRWLLNALEAQTLPATEWHVVVVHDYDEATAGRIIDAHPLAAAGRLRTLRIAAETGSPARQRNLGWRASAAPLVAFTDDDCRPEPGWLAALAATAEARPGDVVQGRTRPDPLERDVAAAPHVRTIDVEPPGRFAQTCNILYPRTLLERLGGFDEVAVTGEDLDLALRARAAGASLAPAPDAVVNHAIEAQPLARFIRTNWKWRHLAYVVKRHPELRRDCVLGAFWEPEHLEVLLALAGLLATRRRRALALLAVPYVRREGRRRGTRARERLGAALELPGRAAQELAEVVTMAAGSARFRTLVL
jgi:GT2 family glycosyltransferase